MATIEVIGNEIRIAPSELRAGTVALRSAAFSDARWTALVRLVESCILHRRDLENARHAAERLADENWPPGDDVPKRTLRTVLMHGAVASYFRCFDSERRHSLRDGQVFRGEPGGLRLHEYWRAMRHGHVAHDSNPWAQARALVEVGADGRALGTYLLALVGSITEEASVAGFRQIVEHALRWVLAECERAQAELHTYVTSLDATTLATLPLQ